MPINDKGLYLHGLGILCLLVDRRIQSMNTGIFHAIVFKEEDTDGTGQDLRVSSQGESGRTRQAA